jgi:hypothetical protein
MHATRVFRVKQTRMSICWLVKCMEELIEGMGERGGTWDIGDELEGHRSTNLGK